MNKVLNKRILRDLKVNFARYSALLLMIIAGMFIIISIVGAAETIIRGTNELIIENKVEDGQFGVFLPLTAEQEKELTDSGATIERMFSADMKMADNSTLRLMKIREKINLIHLDSGTLPAKQGEAVIEKRYSEEHNISVGDSIEIGGVTLTVTGIGTVPEYDSPMNKLSDTAVESSLFGLVFVTAEQYDEILETNPVVEDYCYAYRLNDKLTHDELKEKIKALEFDYTEVEDKYFREMVDDTLGKKKEIQNVINSMCDSTRELSDNIAMAGFEGTEIHKAALKLSDGTARLKAETDEFLDEAFNVEIDNLTSFMKAEDNPRILAAAKDLEMNKTISRKRNARKKHGSLRRPYKKL